MKTIIAIMLTLGITFGALAIWFGMKEQVVTVQKFINDDTTQETTTNAFARTGSYATAIISSVCFITVAILINKKDKTI